MRKSTDTKFYAVYVALADASKPDYEQRSQNLELPKLEIGKATREQVLDSARSITPKGYRLQMIQIASGYEGLSTPLWLGREWLDDHPGNFVGVFVK